MEKILIHKFSLLVVTDKLNRKKGIISQIALAVALLAITSCKKLVDAGPRPNAVSKAVAFADSASVSATLAGTYSTMYNSFNTDQPYGAGITFLNSLYADELNNVSYPQFQSSVLNNANASVNSIWTESYSAIYKVNSIIEGVSASPTLSASVKQKALGEAKFLRAFCYFYLQNLYGKIPLVTSTNLAVNQTLGQVSPAAVYEQIIADLKDAADGLAADYSVSGGQRTRVNKYAAVALLARVYLYTGDNNNAEAQASLVIASTGQYNLVSDLGKVFSANSSESIWQFETLRPYTYIGFNFVPGSGSTPRFVITNGLINSFEPSDNRKTKWTATSGSFPYPAKYFDVTGGSQFDAVLRLAEQYLIRAEARAKSGNITGAQSDLNIIRTRAGLPNTTATNQTALLGAIEQERRVELFCEWGHRFLDLKRTGRLDAVLGAAKPGMWKTTASNYPIPVAEISKNNNLVQNPGY